MNGLTSTPEVVKPPGSPTRRLTPPQTAIVDVKPFQPGDISKLESRKMKRTELALKLCRSFWGEFVARCFLLGLCGATIWRLTKSDLDFPHWGYALLGIGALLSICDCLQALWYKVHLYAYWRFYKYQHWKGRTWFDPNTVFCLLTIVPALAFTELAIYNANQLQFADTLPQSPTFDRIDMTTPPRDVTPSQVLARSRRDVNATMESISATTFIDATARISTVDSTTATITTAKANMIGTTAPNIGPRLVSTDTAQQNLDNSTSPMYPDLQGAWGRDLSLLLLHHVTCLLLVLVRVQIRRPDSLQRLQLSSLAFELLLHAADLDNLIVTGLDEKAVQASRPLFVGVMVLWGVGFLALIFVLSRRHEAELFPIDRKKLETFYCCVIMTLQDAPRFGLRLAIVIITAQMGLPPAETYTMFFALKNALCLLLYFHRLDALWSKGDYDLQR